MDAARKPTPAEVKLNIEARETLDILYEISLLLNTGLSKEALATCVSLCEQGVNPEALAAVIKELKRESRAVQLGRQDDMAKE
ncbi:hypothetical protein HDU96_010348 [Phlyctochytrium bullatum]|nr:hypothetical protein HDU96_010348 [Phlyctochytrium bullatum]